MDQVRDRIMNLLQYTGIQVRGGETRTIEDTVIKEGRFRLFLNGSLFSGLVASNDMLRELGAGFVISQGLASGVGNVTVSGEEIHVTASIHGDLEREIATTGSVSVRRPLQKVNSSLSITKDDVFAITAEIETEIWRKTGGVHCSVLFHEDRVVVKSSDVGRHNTVDKVIGHAVLQGLDLSRCVIGCTGRQPRDMVAKYAYAGIPIVISRAASTDRGIATAEESCITLVCFSRGDRFTVYTHTERIRDLFPGCG
jgi:FdhD protein